MTPNPNWPRVRIQFAWDAVDAVGALVAGDPNDSDITLIWTDATDQTAGVLQTGRGKQYELDQPRSKDHTLTLRNTTGEFDSANTASRCAGRINAHRPVRVVAAWPPASRQLLGHDLATGGETTTIATDVLRAVLPTAATTAAAWQGTTSLGSTVASGATGTVWTVYPGDATEGAEHTFSAMLASTAGLSVQLVATCYKVDGTVLATVIGTAVTLSAAPTWTRAQVTVTPPSGTLVVAVNLTLTSAAASAATLFADGLQWEQGATASTWEEPGTDYPVITAYVDTWHQVWDLQTLLGWVQITATDALGVLSQLPLLGAYQSEVVSDSPLAYWELAEPQGSTSSAATIPADRTDPGVLDEDADNTAGDIGSTTPAPPTFGTAMPDLVGAGASVDASGLISGRASGAAWPQPAGYPGHVTVRTKLLGSADLSPLARSVPAGQTTLMWAVEAWVQVPTPPPVPYLPVPILTWGGPGHLITVQRDEPTGSFFGPVFAQIDVGTLGITWVASSSRQIEDGQLHHLVLTAEYPVSGVGNATFTLYVDGVTEDPTVVSMQDTNPPRIPGGGGSGLSLRCAGFAAGERTTLGAAPAYWWPGILSHVAVYDPGSTPLTPDRVTAHYQAGIAAFAGEDTGARADRIVRYSGWVGTAHTPTPGYATVQGLYDSGGQSTLQALLGVVTDEQSNLYLGGDGSVTVEQRHDRARRLTPDWTLGEDTAAGEVPYRPGVAVDLDDVQTFNRLRAVRPGGLVVALADQPSVRAHFGRDYPGSPVSLRYDTDPQLVDAAQGILYRYSEPQERISGVVLDPASNTALWPTALGMQIADRVRLHRRPPGGAPAKTLDLYAEQISHDMAWSEGDAHWFTALELSPAFWHQFAMVTAARSTLVGDHPAGSTVLTLTALPDAATNSSQSNGWNVNAITRVQIWVGSAVAEEHDVTAFQQTSPGYTTFTVTLASGTGAAYTAGTVVAEWMDIARGRYDTYDAASRVDSGNLVGF